MSVDKVTQNISKVIALGSQGKEFLQSILKPVSYKRKSVVLHAGDVCLYEMYVVKGCLKIFYTDPEGATHTVKFAVEDWWAFDIESFTLQTPAFYTIQALEDTDVLQISKVHHDQLYARFPVFEKFGRVQFQNSYILLQRRMTQHLFSSADERYAHFREKYPGLELRIPQKEIASYLGITPEFLSMIRHKAAKDTFS